MSKTPSMGWGEWVALILTMGLVVAASVYGVVREAYGASFIINNPIPPPLVELTGTGTLNINSDLTAHLYVNGVKQYCLPELQEPTTMPVNNGKPEPDDIKRARQDVTDAANEHDRAQQVARIASQKLLAAREKLDAALAEKTRRDAQVKK